MPLEIRKWLKPTSSSGSDCINAGTHVWTDGYKNLPSTFSKEMKNVLTTERVC
jgi:hypothetical protein